jgi:hypothetical protein
MKTKYFKLSHSHIQHYTVLREAKEEFKGCITISGNSDGELYKDLEKKAKRYANLISDDFDIAISYEKDDRQLKAMIFYKDNIVDEYAEAKSELEEQKSKRAARQVVHSQKR